MDLSRDTVLWFAGLFEGEGCVAEGKRVKGPSSWFLSVASTDLDVLERVKAAFGGSLRGAPLSRLAKKPCWVWSLGQQEKMYAIVAAIYPFMGTRRKARLEAYFDQFAKRPSSRQSRRNAALTRWHTGATHVS